jgi:hypothetical protein
MYLSPWDPCPHVEHAAAELSRAPQIFAAFISVTPSSRSNEEWEGQNGEVKKEARTKVQA